MLKKSLITLSIFMLVGCGSSNVYRPAGPIYKISDEETKKWIIEGNKFEQCLFPKEVERKTLNNLSKEEQYLHALFVWGKSLQNVVGDNIAQTIFNDNASKNYLNTQLIKFNHSQKANFSKLWCVNVKKEYDTALKQLKIEIERAKQAELTYQKQEESERKAREAYYTNPQVQAELARQQYQQALLAQQRMYQQELAAQRQVAEFKNFTNTLNNSINSFANSMNQTVNMINSMTNSMPRYQYQPQQRSSTTCYRLANGIVRCNH